MHFEVLLTVVTLILTPDFLRIAMILLTSDSRQELGLCTLSGISSKLKMFRFFRHVLADIDANILAFWN